ncbi:cytochrome C [Photobacterium proteolyticum]|uniref:Cytochrome C n=1 Tax=Photobacterium proteolyticum TaxID=1903952 RepID=A0A1Q9G6I0_9GAMM|nr:c-type cytochrome [Photobacterium proteolyticum]OLQ69930.1 cytochrome C [Photobacterium proteolyticum]
MKLPHLIFSTLIITTSPSFADNTIPGAPDWSTPARGVATEAHTTDIKLTLEGSSKQYTQAEIDDKFSAPDWFPQQHAPMPEIVQFGKKPKVWACASCHLASGFGHPESSTLAGLTESYMVQQLEAFASGQRIDYSGHMNRMAPLMTKQEMQAASKWFASLTPRSFITVKEVNTVPVTYVDSTRMRQVDLTKNTEEPIGNRIIEVAVDKEIIHKRSPYGQFISYVPQGSIERGQALVKTGNGKTIPCASCHGSDLTGSSIGPSLAGNFGIYTVRQLHGFKAGTRNSPQSAMMKPVVAGLNDNDIVDIAAYLSSLPIAK